uniref:Lipoprotein n=5 Tax=unclassified Prevotella TaxID=2638335 RepID=A0AB33JJT7_9BACT
MKIRTLFVLGIVSLALVACGGKKDNREEKPNGLLAGAELLHRDKAVYGLACEGCTDSVVVLLPPDGSDPVTYNIINAHRNNQIYGKVKIGDWITVVLDDNNKKVATSVVDLDDLRGIWCYVVMPQMRDYDKMSKHLQQTMMRDMPDSVKATYLIPREYGFWLRRNWVAQSVGYVGEKSSLEDESPVVYPQLGYFTGWRMWNGKLVVARLAYPYGTVNEKKGDSLIYDTCNIDYLKDDSLVLSSDGISRGYYRKKNINDVNKKAIAIAAMLKRKALKQATQ